MGAYQDNLADLKTELKELKDTVQDALSARLLPITVDNVLELALLRGFAAFEQFLEQQFYLCLVSDPSAPGSGGIIQISSRAEAELLLLATPDRVLPFVSWLPVPRLLEAADRFLQPDHPFGRLRYRQTETTALNDLHIVRNAVAHPDSPAMDKFRKLAASRNYTVQRPADYLRARRAGQFELLLSLTRLEVVGDGLSTTDEKAADAILEPESPFNADQKAPVGTYVCTRCGHRISLAVEGAAPGRCPACGPAAPCPACGREPKATDQWRREIS